MSAAEVLEQIRRLSPAERQEVMARVREEFGDCDDELTREQIAELDRRAERALNNPSQGKPVEQVFSEIEELLPASG